MYVHGFDLAAETSELLEVEDDQPLSILQLGAPDDDPFHSRGMSGSLHWRIGIRVRGLPASGVAPPKRGTQGVSMCLPTPWLTDLRILKSPRICNAQ